jgi:tetratricopeptide (TPR) repeat protein
MKDLGAFARGVTVALFVLSIPTAGAQDTGDEECGALGNAFGPFDYRTAGRDTLKVVEDYHFTPEVERLVGGKSGAIDGDLDYTLRAFPNHHRALFALAKYSLQKKTDRLPNMRHSVPCWFERAMRYAPDDGDVHAVFGYYLTRTGKHAASVAALEKAIELGSDSGNNYYNLGLVQLELKQYAKALDSAHKARERGFTLPGLKKKLQAIGQWREASVGQ